MKGNAAQQESQRWKRKREQTFFICEKRLNATWNLERCKNQVDGRGTIQDVLSAIHEHKWEVVFLSEILFKDSGIWWYANSSVLIHGKRGAVILRKQWAMAKKEQGSKKRFDERFTMVTFKDTKLIAVHLPVSPNDGEIEEYRKNLETALACRRKNKIVLTGGDHNAPIGCQNIIRKTVGAFGLEPETSAKGDIVACAQQKDLQIVDTYVQKNNRSTWCHLKAGIWYELDYFLAKQCQRLVVKNIKVVPDDKWSHQKPQEIQVLFRQARKNKYRVPRTEKTDWKKLRSEAFQNEYRQRIAKTQRLDNGSWES